MNMKQHILAALRELFTQWEKLLAWLHVRGVTTYQ